MIYKIQIMELLRTISFYAEAKNMPFLVIGGQALNAHGISRQTGDIDLVVQRSSRDKWLELMQKLNYSKNQDDQRFAKFKPDSIAAWPVDLMFVDDETFAKLLSEGIEIDFGLVRAKVVSARHLATLKIHALKHYQEHRHAKDYTDLINLLRSGKTDLSDTDLKQLCDKYANASLYDRLKAEIKK